MQRLRSVTSFADAERQPMPRLLVPWSWDAIRHYFTRQVRRVLAQTVAQPPRSPDQPGPRKLPRARR